MAQHNPVEKALPHNNDAERSVLGAILLSTDPKTLETITDKLRSSDFFLRQHQTVFQAILKLREEKRAIDSVTLTDQLADAAQLEAAGGAGYISSLLDGVPQVTNVGHYASIVREKALLREFIHAAELAQQRAWGGVTRFEDVAADMEVFLRRSPNGRRKHLKTVDLHDFLVMDLRPRAFVIDPVLPRQGLAMIHSWRGTGKTLVAMEMARCVASGTKFLMWTVPQRRKVLFVDGEMPANEFRERLQKLAIGNGMQIPERGWLQFITPDLQDDGLPPNIATTDGQRVIEEHLDDDTFLILDNLSALLRTPKEDEEGWGSVQEWLLYLRQRGVTVLFLHHSGKGGTQRGTSKREDLLHLVINLRLPSDYAPNQDFRAEAHIEKVRGRAGAAALPFEMKLETAGDGLILTWRPLKDIIERRAGEMSEAGMKVHEIAEELHVSRFTIYRMLKKLRSEGSVTVP